MLGSLLLLSSREVNPRFYRTHYLVAMGLIAVALIAGPHTLADGLQDIQETLVMMRSLDKALMLFGLGAIILPIAAFFCTLGSISWSIESHPGSRIIGMASVTSLVVALGCRAAGAVQQFQLLDFAVRFAGELSSAALLGAAVTAMLLGHFYLIAPGMSLSPLMRLLTALFVATGLRMVLAGWGLWSWTANHSLINWEDETVLWLPVRWGLGFGGPLILGWMARSAAKIRSTQSATGILYVVVVFSILGELTSQLLMANTGYML
jgi:hypothetical protein